MQTLHSLENRLKGRRTGKRLYFRAPSAAEAQAGAIIVPGPDWLGSDEVVITVGVLRYGQLSCLQVSPLPILTKLPSTYPCSACTHLDGGMPCALQQKRSFSWKLLPPFRLPIDTKGASSD